MTTPPSRRAQRIALTTLMVMAFVVIAWMASPLLVGLVLGTAMAFTAQPLHAALSARWNQRRGLAAAMTTFLGGLTMAGGGALAVWVITRELVVATEMVRLVLFERKGAPLAPRLTRALDSIGIPHEVVVAKLREEVGRLGDAAAHGAGLLLQASVGVLLTLVIAIWTTFYVLRDWPRIQAHLERLLPLDPRDTRALVDEFREVGRHAFIGTLASAAVQGTLGGVGFALFGVPQAATWGTILALASFIPVVGTALVWVPAVVWLLTTGHLVRAVLLAIWSLLIVMAGNDYVIRPRLVEHGESHPLLTLVGLIGGISVFGIAGLVVGPVIVSLFLATAHIYERERFNE